MTYEKAVAKVVKNWEKLRSLQIAKKFAYGDYSNVATLFGDSHWDNPDLVWVYLTSNEEGYEGSQVQLGITRDGRVLYEYQSHCSCNGYEDAHGEDGCPMPEDTTKTYELNTVPKEWKIIVVNNVEKLLDLVKKKL